MKTNEISITLRGIRTSMKVKRSAYKRKKIFIFKHKKQTGTTPKRDSSFSYAHMREYFYTYIPAILYATKLEL